MRAYRVLELLEAFGRVPIHPNVNERGEVRPISRGSSRTTRESRRPPRASGCGASRASRQPHAIGDLLIAQAAVLELREDLEVERVEFLGRAQLSAGSSKNDMDSPYGPILRK
jgi:hypothetical protein